MSVENSPNTHNTPLRRRKARPFSVMVSKKDAESLPEYPVFGDAISPELASALSASIASKSPDRTLARASVHLGMPLSPMTPQTKSNAKKRMASELTMLSEYLNDLERERLEEAELHESLLTTVEDLRRKKQKVEETLSGEQDKLEVEYRQVKKEYLATKRVRDELQQQLDQQVTNAWKSHVHTIQASDWFADYERSLF